MRRYRFSEAAYRDLDEVVDYLHSIGAPSRKLIGAIEARCYGLAQMPESGRPRDDLRPGLRSGLANGHLIFYIIDDEGIEIVRVLNGRRDIRSIFRGSP